MVPRAALSIRAHFIVCARVLMTSLAANNILLYASATSCASSPTRTTSARRPRSSSAPSSSKSFSTSSSSFSSLSPLLAASPAASAPHRQHLSSDLHRRPAGSSGRLRSLQPPVQRLFARCPPTRSSSRSSTGSPSRSMPPAAWAWLALSSSSFKRSSSGLARA